MFLPSFTGTSASVALHNPDVSNDIAQLDHLLWNMHLNEFDSFTRATIMNDFCNDSLDADVDLDKNRAWVQTTENDSINIARELFFQNDNEFVVVETMKTNSNDNDIVMQKKTMHVFIIIIV